MLPVALVPLPPLPSLMQTLVGVRPVPLTDCPKEDPFPARGVLLEGADADNGAEVSTVGIASDEEGLPQNDAGCDAWEGEGQAATEALGARETESVKAMCVGERSVAEFPRLRGAEDVKDMGWAQLSLAEEYGTKGVVGKGSRTLGDYFFEDNCATGRWHECRCSQSDC